MSRPIRQQHRRRSRRSRPSSPPTPARARPRPWSTGWRACCWQASQPESDPLRHLHQGRRRRDAAPPVRPAGRLGGDGRRDAAGELAELDGPRPDDLRRPTCPTRARLFAQALETPGGLKIQTIHAFCEKLLRRFPLEAGVSPGFRVMDDAAAADLSRAAPARTWPAAPLADADGPRRPRLCRISRSRSTSQSFEAMFARFEAERGGLVAYFDRVRRTGGAAADVWRAAASTPTETTPRRSTRGRLRCDGLDRGAGARPPRCWRHGLDRPTRQMRRR